MSRLIKNAIMFDGISALVTISARNERLTFLSENACPFCLPPLLAVSGVTPEDPVVSVKSGLLFERRLIEKALAVRMG